MQQKENYPNNINIPPHTQEQYQEAVEDEELNYLMQQVKNKRKLEMDYKNIENQIRCLKLRMFQQNQDNIKLRHSDNNEDENAEGLAEDLVMEHAAKERRRVELENRYTQQKQEYINLNNLEGDLHSQIADLRGNTSAQMMQNKALETRLG